MYLTRHFSSKLPRKIALPSKLRNDSHQNTQVQELTPHELAQLKTKKSLAQKWAKNSEINEKYLVQEQLKPKILDKDKSGKYMIDLEVVSDRLNNLSSTYKTQSPLAYLSDKDRRLPKSWSKEDQDNFEDSIKNKAFKDPGLPSVIARFFTRLG